LEKLARTEGIICAIESAHGLAGALRLAKGLKAGSRVLVNLSGRGDKDMGNVVEYFGFEQGE
jgi:tryptophan synthase beta chain